MTESVIDPEVQAALTPAFGLLPDFLDFLDRASTRWHTYALPHQPPAELAHLHDPYLFATHWERLLAAMRSPAREIGLGGTRYVNVLGCCVVQVNPDRTMEAHLWVADTLGQPRLERLDAWTVVLQGMPYRDLWLRALARLAALEVERRAQDRGVATTPEQAGQYSQWAFGVYRRQLKRHADLRQMRSAIATALAYDRDLVPLAGRIPRTTLPRNVVSMGAYNRVVRHEAAMRQIQQEVPHLMPAFGGLCDRDGFPGKGEPLQRLRRHLLADDHFKPATWRMLLKAGPRLLQPLTRYYRDDPAEATFEHLRLLAMLGLRQAPPVWIVDAILGTWGDIGNRWPSYYTDLFAYADSWRHIVQLLAKRQPSAALLNELDLVQRWMTKTGEMFEITKSQKAAGWPWLVRRASAWAERHAREQRAKDECWPAPFDLAHIGDLELRPLRSSLALWEEALAMRHCADIFAEKCSTGQVVLVSVRREWQRVATAEIRRHDQGWRLQQVKGFANAAVPAELESQLRRFVASIVVMNSVPAARFSVVVKTAKAADLLDLEEDDEEVDLAAVEAALKDELVAAMLDDVRGPDHGTLMRRVEVWLESLNDEGNLSYHVGGRLILNHQIDDWRGDLSTWLDHAHNADVLDAERIEQLVEAEDAASLLTPHEAELLENFFVETVLASESTDEDRYGIWGAEEVKASDGRSVWSVYRITGYSFTSVEMSLLDVCGSLAEVKEVLRSVGRFSGWETMTHAM